MLTVYGPDPNHVKHQHIRDFLEVRRKEFVEGLQWDIPSTSKREWDQYDLPDALFAICYEGETCVGGARIIPTNAERTTFFGIDRSWMLADFAKNNTGGLAPIDQTLPHDASVWEMTRFVGKSNSVRSAILSAVNEYLEQHGGTNVLTLSPTQMPVILRRLGYQTSQVSPPVEFDGRQYVVLNTEVNANCHK